jgi:putative thioredoxin
MTLIGETQAKSAGDLIKDGTDASFAADVIEASRDTPVIVDFWATWCGPCRQLGPALERAVTAAKGKVKLVKIDIDKNPQFAGQLRVQ